MRRLLLNTVLALLATTALEAREHRLAEPIRDGEVWIAVRLTPKSGKGHAGWDVFDGSAKQFWIGSGWRIGADHHGKWGLWHAPTGAPEFPVALAMGREDRLVVRVRFGEAAVGDETVELWLNPKSPTAEEPVATLRGVAISGVSHLRYYTARGTEYDAAEPEVAGSFEALGATIAKPPTPPARGADRTSAERLFADVVAPLFGRKCSGCHGDKAKKIKGEFDMRSRELLLKGGESGEPSIIPGDAERSPLYRSLLWTDPDLEMPPKENDRMSAGEIAAVKRWIDAGAPWARRPVAPGPEGDPWAQPADGDGVLVRTSGGLDDAWTYRRYQPDSVWAFRPRKEVPVPQGGGNPIDAFIGLKLDGEGLKPAPRADARTLRRRAAYALTGLPPSGGDAGLGFDKLLEKLLASEHYGERMAQHWFDVARYADSNGFARDEFRKEAWRYRDYVIAAFKGDLPYDQFVREQIAGDELGSGDAFATGFLWMGPWEHTAMSVAAVTRQRWLDDVVNSVGVTFLGQQLLCAKCHDHKFDPVPTRDYYSMQAIFAASDHNVKGGEFKIRTRKSAPPISILRGGAIEAPGEAVVPAALSAVAFDGAPGIPEAATGRRAALARWIAHPGNPLTARVMVNRVWQMHFGRGLVKTANDFGKMGARPTHPDLLDWLAGWFVDDGWSVKKLHRLIMSSEAWARSTEHPGRVALDKVDPDNELLAYFEPRRMSAEEIRDSMLAASFELNRKVGGPSNYPEINWEVALQPRLQMGKVAPPYEPDPEPGQRHRRTLYAVKLRNLPPPMRTTFNQPGSEMSCDRRDETTVATQALTLLHGQFSHDRALALAHRIASAEADPGRQVDAVFEAIYGRAPSAGERTAAVAHIAEMTKSHRAKKLEPVVPPKQVKMAEVAERTGETTYKTFTMKKMEGFEPDLKPWDVPAESRALAELCLVMFNSSEFLYVY